MKSGETKAITNDIDLHSFKKPENIYSQALDEEDELDEAIDLCFSGKEIPLDETLQIVLKRIFAILDEAREDSAYFLPRALMITCIDEVKRACREGLITTVALPDAVITLCLAVKRTRVE